MIIYLFINVTYNYEKMSNGGFDFWLLGILFIALLVIGIIAAGIIFLWRREKKLNKEKENLKNPISNEADNQNEKLVDNDNQN